jgi:hypothetical protein
MDSAGFHKLRMAAQEAGRPAETWYARRVQRALEGAFERSGLFADVELGRTDDLDRMVIGVCRCADGVLPWEAGAGVEQLWRTAVLDACWESHAVSCTDSIMEFEGAVTFDEAGHYVTVNIVAEPPTVRELQDVAHAPRVEPVAGEQPAPVS